MEENKKSYYAVIPADVRYDSRLKANAKLLYGEVTALCNDKGYCWANNQYFADLYGVKKQTISAWLKQLKDCGYINIEIQYRGGSKEIINRYIEISGEGINKKQNTPPLKKVKDNTTVFNNTLNTTLNNNNKGFETIIEPYTQNEIFKKTIFDFIKMRKAIKKPLTDTGLKLILDKLNKLANDENTKINILNQSIMNSWQGVFPLKEDKKTTQSKYNPNVQAGLNLVNKYQQESKKEDGKSIWEV